MEERIEKLKAKLVAQYKKDDRFIGLSDEYTEESVKSFIETYASYKASLQQNGNPHKENARMERERMEKLAIKCLAEIQHKKLFDLECQWRANRIKLPRVEISEDFNVLAENILQADVPEQITFYDIEFYQQYLVSPEADLYHVGPLYPYFGTVKDAFENDDNDHEGAIPIYFKYHMQKTGSDSYLRLTDIRGKKEGFYEKLFYQNQKKKNTPQPVTEKPLKPSLSTMDEEIARVAAQFDSKKLARFIRNFNESNSNSFVKVDFAFLYLSQQTETIPIESGDNWRESLYIAYKRHEYKCLSAILPQVWEEYLMKKKMNVAFESDQQMWQKRREMTAKRILEGRLLNGEPANFDF
jgi:hypothetical protein